MRQSQGALDVVRNRFRGGVGKIIERENDNMIANADSTVFPAISKELVACHPYHLFVFRL
jgi:hypothetical protein